MRGRKAKKETPPPVGLDRCDVLLLRSRFHISLTFAFFLPVLFFLQLAHILSLHNNKETYECIQKLQFSGECFTVLTFTRMSTEVEEEAHLKVKGSRIKGQ